MRNIPKAPTESLESRVRTVVAKTQKDQPHYLTMAACDAEFMRARHQVYVKAGFTDDQAFQLILRK